MKINKRVLGIVSISLVLLTLIGVLSACSFLEAEQEISNTSIIEVIDNSEINIETIKSEEEVDKNISVKFIDVGQADSCVIVTPNNDVILIDAGEKKDASEIIPELDKYEFEDIDLMILSHPHADHIGGAETLIGKYDVNEVLMCSYPATSKLFNSLLDCLTDKSIKTSQASEGMKYSIDGVNIEVIAVDTIPKDNNNSSIVCKISYGEIDMLFMGDAETQTEEVILSKDLDIDCDILKVGHHGSETSTSDEFLDIVSPSLCVISVGEGNSYNHPAEDTLLKFKDRNISYYRTDELGSIELEIDGTNIVSNFTDSYETENTQSGNFLLEPAVAEVHLHTEEDVLNQVSENK